MKLNLSRIFIFTAMEQPDFVGLRELDNEKFY